MGADVRSDVVVAPVSPARSVARLAARPLHVCHVISADLWAGAEVQVATTAAFLVKQSAVKLRAVLFNEGQLADTLRDLGVPTAVFDERRNGPLVMVRALTRHFADHQIDIVHTHRHSDTVIGTIAAALAGIPRVVRTVHGLREPFAGWQRIKYRAYEALERRALRLGGDGIIAVSEHVADDLRRQGHDRSRVFPIRNGIDLAKVRSTHSSEAMRQSLGLGGGRIVIGTAGRLTPVKAQERLIRAARAIRRHEPRAAFLIVGDGPRRQALMDYASRLGISDACVFTGEREDTYDLVAAMDVFALPSLSEGTPMALLEAMALGTPIVATAVGGVPEVVENGVHGLLVKSGDDQALARACLQLTSDHHLARRVAANARERVTEFSAERSGDALLRTYRHVASERRRRRVLLSAAPWCGMAVTLADRAAARIRDDAERRRQRRNRVRNGLELAGTLRKARRVLVLCQGNVIRSAYAAHLLAGAAGNRLSLAVCSAGLDAVAGRPADPRAVLEARSRGIDLSHHVACRVDRRTVAEADAVLVMEAPQLLAIRQRFPEARSKTFLLATLADGAPLEIADPVLGDGSMFEACFDHVERAVAPLLRVLAARSAGPC